MRILFFTPRWVLRHFDNVVVELAGRGHEVVIAMTHQRLPKRMRLQPGVRRELYDDRPDRDRAQAVDLLRRTRDYVWYLSGEQDVATLNRRRALDALVQGASQKAREAEPSWPDPIVAMPPDAQATIDAALGEIDSRIPPDREMVELIRRLRPDAVLVSPLVHRRYRQTEAVKAARELGVPSGLLVRSWDNLSSKGRIHVAPDRIFVWNDVQKREAVELHGIDPESVVATGAPHWDGFFTLRPAMQRAEFCAMHGFDPDLPIVLYLGSTKDIAPNEIPLVERWLEAVRSAPGPLGDANVLVRWHPGEAERYRDWSPGAERVSTSGSLQRGGPDLYEDLHHSGAAVGLNTTAQIEASILGKPVYTFSGGDLAPGQQGSRHFYYLLKDHDGAVAYAETLAEHVVQLERGVAGDFDGDAIRRFCESFVRPRGLDRPVAPIVADEVVNLAAAGRRPGRRLRLRLSRRAAA